MMATKESGRWKGAHALPAVFSKLMKTTVEEKP
jgi:hypothetical protein